MRGGQYSGGGEGVINTQVKDSGEYFILCQMILTKSTASFTQTTYSFNYSAFKD